GHFPESQQMYVFAKEMERYYKTVRYKAYKGETFYIRTQANTKQMLLDMLEFFDQYLRDKVVSPGASAPVGVRESGGCRVQSAECRVQSAECRVQSAECRVQSAECR